MDAPERWAAVANDAANIGWLLAAAVTVLLLAFFALVAYRRRARRLPAPRPSEGYSVGLFEEERDIYPPTQLERVQRILRDDAARYDTDAMAEMYDHINKERDQ